MRSKVFITGATGGLGKAFAVHAAMLGWDLFLTDLKQEPLDLLAHGLARTYGIHVSNYACDLTLPAARTGLLQYATEQRSRFQMLIHVAGGDHQGRFISRTAAELCSIVRLNVEAPLDLTHGLLALRDPMKTLRVINVSSLAAFFPMPLKATYAASKRFMHDFSLALNDELRDLDVTVTALCPAGIPTTTACIDAIEAHGYAGYLTTKNLGDIVGETINAAMKARPMVIPGWPNRILRALSQWIPTQLVAAFIGRRWRKTGNQETYHRSTHFAITDPKRV